MALWQKPTTESEKPRGRRHFLLHDRRRFCEPSASADDDDDCDDDGVDDGVDDSSVEEKDVAVIAFDVTDPSLTDPSDVKTWRCPTKAPAWW